METSKNLASQIVDTACQEFQQIVNRQAILEPMAQKAGMQAKAYKIITLFILALFFITMFASLFVKQGYNMVIIAISAVGIVGIVFFILYLRYEGKERACYREIKIITAGRLNYIKEIINRALMEHMCANDDNCTEDFYFKRIKKITRGFFADDFKSSLTEEETAEIRNWLKASYAACLQAT